jgi:hypothetical protein
MSEPISADLSFIHENLRHLAMGVYVVQPDPFNARVHERASIEAIKESLSRFGQDQVIVVRRATMTCVKGSGRLLAARELFWTHVAVMLVDDDEVIAAARGLADNRTAELSHWDSAALGAALQRLREADAVPTVALGWTEAELAAIIGMGTAMSAGTAAPSLVGEGTGNQTIPDAAAVKRPSLADRFLVPPFSVLDARQGYWQERKRAWLSIGIRSESRVEGPDTVGSGRTGRSPAETFRTGAPGETQKRWKERNELIAEISSGRLTWEDATAAYGGRPDNKEAAIGHLYDQRKSGKSDAEIVADWIIAHRNEISRVSRGGTSIFDPVLCELAYLWFVPPGGHVLDPFAGGSVRGIVAHCLGRRYTGIDLRPEQIAANREQGTLICPGNEPRWIEGDAADAGTLAPGEYDAWFSCPPYANLERYSDDPRDLSTMKYADFLLAFRRIAVSSCNMLRNDRFAVCVMGNVRDKSGFYCALVADTISAFSNAGLNFYNEAILVNAAGSLPIRAGSQFVKSRKLGKTHQHCLVFVKGDPRAATAAVGPVLIDQGLFAETGVDDDSISDAAD